MNRRKWRQLVVCVPFALAMLLFAAPAAAVPLAPVALPGTPGSEIEPNDSTATATAIDSGERIRASLPAGGDVDYYSFTAQEGERVFANTVTAGSTGSGNTVLTLLDSGENPIAEDDDDGSQLGKASSIAGFRIPTTGIYFLRVSNAGSGAISPYDLYFQLRSLPPASEAGSNEIYTEATPLGSGEVVGEHTVNDMDWFSLQLQAGDTVFLSLAITSGDASKAQLGFGLTPEPGKEPVTLLVPAPSESPDAGSPSEALTMTVSAGGTYYVRVGSSDGTVSDPTWTYDLSATVIPAAQPSCRTYTSTGGSIPDGGSASFPIEVEDSLQIQRAAIALNLKESLMRDIEVSLRTPALAELPLFTGIGATGPEEQTEMEAVFDDFAAVPSQYKTLRPLDLQPQAGPRLALLAGQQTIQQGKKTWTLVIKDDQLNGWSGTLREAKLILCGPEIPLPPGFGGGSKRQAQPAPVLSNFAIAPGKFRAAKAGPMVMAKRPRAGGALVSYQDSLAAQTNILLFELEPGRKLGRKCVRESKGNVTRKPCSRKVKVISFVRQDVAGGNRFGFSGRVGARKLPPGDYLLQATAYAPSGLTSAPVSATFTILPPVPSK